ncbi:9155_t:CDS:1, partial [Gigaspora margarita]
MPDNKESEISVQEVLSNMGWESTDDNKPHEIYIKLDDLISQTETPVVEKNVKP